MEFSHVYGKKKKKIQAKHWSIMKNLNLHISGWIRPFWASLDFFCKKKHFLLWTMILLEKVLAAIFASNSFH